MGDVSHEPSMEEILSSIKRIIAEEGDSAISTRTRRPSRAPARLVEPVDLDEILELDAPVAEALPRESRDLREEPVPMPMGSPTPAEPATRAETAPRADAIPRAEAGRSEPAPRAEATAPAEPILSERAAEATRGPLEALSRMVVKPDVSGSDTLEGLVRELLKPMLRDWLDTNLPRVVEEMVAREISRITAQR
jgi:uncharacterized protein